MKKWVRGEVHTQVGKLNVNDIWGVGVVDFDARIVAKWYFSDLDVKHIYHVLDYATNMRNRSYENVHYDVSRIM